MRRTVRHFSDKAVPQSVIEDCVMAAASAPSGANKQPWHFAVVKDKSVKKQIREAAEKEEKTFYEHRATNEWLRAIAHLGTDANKPFLEKAPYLIVVFEQRYGLDENGRKTRNYYTTESVGIAVGMLITALHMAGLATLTHTPAPMNFLNGILKRPKNEKPFVILVTGYPDDAATVPNIYKKSFSEVATIY